LLEPVAEDTRKRILLVREENRFLVITIAYHSPGRRALSARRPYWSDVFNRYPSVPVVPGAEREASTGSGTD